MIGLDMYGNSLHVGDFVTVHDLYDFSDKTYQVTKYDDILDKLEISDLSGNIVHVGIRFDKLAKN